MRVERPHEYQAPENVRRNGEFFLLGIGLLAAWTLGAALNTFSFSVPWWLDAPSVFGFYGIARCLFDEWGWRTRLVQRISLLAIPDLRGQWSATIRTSYDNFETPIEATVTIQQTWTKFRMQLMTTTSASTTTGARVDEVAGEVALDYWFDSTPTFPATDTMNRHIGSAHLRGPLHELRGEYMTGRGRVTHGRLDLVKSELPSGGTNSP